MSDEKGQIHDPTVRIKVSSKLSSYILNNSTLKKELGDHHLKELDADQLKKIQQHFDYNFVGDTLSGQDLDDAFEEFMQSSHEKINVEFGPSLHDLLSPIETVLPKNVEILRSPELEARIEKLKIKQKEREYQQLVRSITSKKTHPEDTIAQQLKMMNRHMIAVFQVILSVGAGFAFGFLGIPLIVGYLDFGYRLSLGLFCAFVIAVAELYFLAKHLVYDDLKPDDNNMNENFRFEQ